MKAKEIIVTMFLVILVSGLFALNYVANKLVLRADSVYKVYLNGSVIGYLENDDELYSIINKRQKEIREKYDVQSVYPPENFEIVKTNSYNVTISSAEEIYDKVADLGSFTIEGYTIKITPENEEVITVNVLNQQHFDDAIHNFVLAFLSEEEYTNYINNTQAKIETTGKNIEMMYFDETITIKKGYVSVDEKVYTNVTELSQLLLFGFDYKNKTYTIKAGDTIETVSEKNKLNPQEFLIANPKYTSKESLLKIGDKVNVTLIDPIITFSYEVNEVSDSEIAYDKKVVTDKTKPYGYSEITTVGVTGVTRITAEYLVKNGETQQGVVITNQEVITEKVDQVTTVGGPQYNVTGSYIDTGTEWQWPTNQPSVVTSYWGYRGGSFHEGIDISGTGYGSPIYAAADGEVVNARYGGFVGDVSGYNVVIKHDNGYYTVYAHMAPNTIAVKEGQRVTRGQTIGGMGHSGLAYGTHVHFGVTYGKPYGGGYTVNPMSLWQ
ncbi:MAG: M23 family metallopeptidase [Firmicutes bacterium]|nr:M23 family metallopeptidase [Bacillota bacterium]